MPGARCHLVRRVVLSVAVCASLVLAGYRPLAHPATPRSHASAPVLTKVILALGFIPNVQFAPYYIAIDKGYYRAAGFDVQLEYGAVPDLLHSVASGRIDFMITTGDGLVSARAADIPITYVMAQFQRYPVGALAIKGNGAPLWTPGGLKGRTIGISGPNGATYIGLRALLQAGHLTERDVKVISIGFTENEALTTRRVDVAMTYLTNEPVQLRALGYNVETLDTYKYISLISTGLATGAGNARTRPDFVQRFVTASLRGLRYTQAHPDEAFAASMRRTPEIVGNNVRIQRAVLAATLAYEQPPAGHPLGWSSPIGWRTTASFLRSIGLIKNPVDEYTLYTNRFADNATP